MAAFPFYADLLQPVCLGVLELCTGLATLQCGSRAHHAGRADAALAQGLAALMSPAELHAGEVVSVWLSALRYELVPLQARATGYDAAAWWHVVPLEQPALPAGVLFENMF